MARKIGGSREGGSRGTNSEAEPGDWIVQLPFTELELILDHFDRERLKGKPEEATALLIEAAAGVIAGQLSDGIDPDEALRAVGLRSASPVVKSGLHLLQPASEVLKHLPIARLSDPVTRFRLLHHISYTVLVGGGVNNVPSPDCMASHLPDDRKATPEELQEAWEECTQ
jgi:hypothetical protein